MIKLVEIGKCCEIVSGSTPSRIEKDYWGGNINWTSIKDLSNLDDKFIFETSERITERGFKSCSTNMIPPNSLLLSSRAPIGHLAINSIELCTNQGFKSLIPNKEVDVNYLYYAVKRIVPKLKDLGNGATFKELSKSTLSKVTIPLPPLETQQRIATILDAADALRKKTQQIIDSYDELAQSIFLDMFGDPVMNPKGWKKTNIGESCYFVKDGPHVSPKYVEKGVPFVSVNNIIKGYWDLENVRNISEEDHRIFKKRCNPEKGDILYTKGGTTGFAKYIDIDLEFSNWVHLAVLKFDKSKMNGRFFESMLNSNYCYIQSQIATRGIANRDLVLGEMKKIIHFLPPITLQTQFAEKIALIDQQKELAKQSLKESEDLFNTLLQKAFKGELEIKRN